MKINLLFWLAVCLVLVSCGGNTDDPTPDCSTSGLALQLSGSQNASCGNEDGELTVAASGGAGEYEYSKDGSTYQSEGAFSALAASNYTITVRDANNCTKTLEVNIENEDGINLVTSMGDAGCGSTEGSITLTASGGVEPYEFKLGNGDFGSANVFENLSHGTYSVTAKDAEGCAVTQQVSIESGISYTETVAPIIRSNCAVSGCHVGTAGIPDFTSFGNIQSNAALIKTKTANKSMPKTGSLTETEIQAIACWVDDGAKDN